MKVKAVKIAAVILGMVVLISSIVMIPLLTSELFVLTTIETGLFVLMMFCGFLMVLAGASLEDKYTTYDELHGVKK